MEDIIDRIVFLDNNAKAKVNDIKLKSENIENIITRNLEKEKSRIDNEYAFKKNKLQEKYDLLFKKRKEDIDKFKNSEINRLQELYLNKKDKDINDLLNSIM